jgi:hypothetical protein
MNAPEGQDLLSRTKMCWRKKQNLTNQVTTSNSERMTSGLQKQRVSHKMHSRFNKTRHTSYDSVNHEVERLQPENDSWTELNWMASSSTE